MAAGQRNQSVRFGVSIVLTFFMCMVVASWTATQYFAALLEYQPGLGEAVLDLHGGQKIYQPFSWFLWNIEWINETGVDCGGGGFCQRCARNLHVLPP